MFNLFIVIIVATLLFFVWQLIRLKFIKQTKNKFKFPRDYLVGINYLLNEQEDKALEVFINLLEVDQNTVETHLALGSLFRRKGEVNRAIRIHQNIIARPQLSQEQRLDALLALGHDYLNAGVLDRAERVFLDLLQAKDGHSHSALYSLLDIYQQEKSWRKAIQISKKIQDVTGKEMAKFISHHYCELSESAIEGGDITAAIRYLKSALAIQHNSIRANLLDARIFEILGKHKKALSRYKKVVENDIIFLPEVIKGILNCYEQCDKKENGIEYLRSLHSIDSKASVFLLATEEIYSLEHDFKFILSQLEIYPSLFGLAKILNIVINDCNISEEQQNNLLSLGEVASKLAGASKKYFCNHCGFISKALLWYCPSCKKWDSILLSCN